MDIRCSYSSCENIPKYICLCSENGTILCLNHWAEHMESNYYMNHQPKNLQININAQGRSEAINFLQERQELGKNLMKQYISDFEKLLIELNAFQNLVLHKLRSYINQCKKMQKEIIKTGRLTTLLPKTKENILEISADDIKEEIANRTLTETYNSYQICSSFKNLLQNLKINETNETLIYVDDLKKEELLLSVVENTKTIIYYDINEAKLTNINLNLNANFDENSSVCFVDNKTIFIHSSNKFNSNMTFSYDFREKSLIKLPDGKFHKGAEATLHKNKIYFFGGSGNKSEKSDIADFFDLQTKTWHAITKLPQANTCSSNVPFEKNIVLAVHNCKVFNYDCENDSYDELADEIGFSGGHFIIKSNDFLYCVSSKSFFCDVQDFKSWLKLDFSVKLELKCGGCRPIVRDNKVYFFDKNNIVYELELESFSIKKLS